MKLRAPSPASWRLISAVIVTAAVTATGTLTVVKRELQRPRRPVHGRADGTSLVGSALHSRVLGERREILVHRPESYEEDPARRYPVLYVLDGGSQDGPTARTARLLARLGLMPEILVIGVPNFDQETRWRDFTPPSLQADAGKRSGRRGQADRLLAFLETEVVPHVEQTERTAPPRMIAGHSLGGLFVLYAFLEKPRLFDGWFAYSPSLWLGDGRMIDELRRAFPAQAAAPAFLYLSVGDGEGPGMIDPFTRAVEVVRRLAPPAFRFRADVTKHADHLRNPELSTPVALQEYFRAAMKTP